MQDRLLVDPDANGGRLPGTRPLPLTDWILRDDAFARQMAYRDHLIEARSEEVTASTDDATGATRELLAMLLSHLAQDPDYQIKDSFVLRPDGVRVSTDLPPLSLIGRLSQSDFCLIEANGAQRLIAGVLCFPASWSLQEKLGRSLLGVHAPVDVYDDDIGRRVGRMFSLLKPDRILWRSNFLRYDDPDLFQPRRENARRGKSDQPRYIRVERQTIRRLPNLPVIAFGIHSFVVRDESVKAEA